MSTMTKVFVVLTAVLTIVVSVLYIGTAAQWQQYKETADQNARKVAAAKAIEANAIATLHAQTMEYNQSVSAKDLEIERLKLQVDEATGKVKELTNELAIERNKVTEATASAKKASEMVSLLVPKSDSLQKANDVLNGEKIRLQAEVTELNAKVLDLSALKMNLTNEVRNLQEKLFQAERLIAQMEQTGGGAVEVAAAQTAVPTIAGPIKGEIVDVDNTYATVNIGESSGLVEGMTLMVYRSGQFLGEFKVRTVLPNEAGGRLNLVQGEIRIGDAVSYSQS